jgi:hypothetical protein
MPEVARGLDGQYSIADARSIELAAHLDAASTASRRWRSQRSISQNRIAESVYNRSRF